VPTNEGEGDMNASRKKRLLVLAAAILGVMLMVQVAIATHPRPKGASPVRVSLVPAFEKCTAPNMTHGPPLGFPSCSPPVPTSQFLTVGTPDANGAAANSVGNVRLAVLVGTPGPPDDSSLKLDAKVTDVRCKTGVSACGSANAQDGPDYTGELEGFATARVTDHYNATATGGGTDPATMQDIPFPFTMSCASTADTSTGSVCEIPRSTECLGCPPPKEGVRTVIELTQIQVRDGGADGVAATQGNTLFMVQGVFIP
jgi:hypothetical protein